MSSRKLSVCLALILAVVSAYLLAEVLAADPPSAAFSGEPTEGYKPLTVQFTDLSTGDITSWRWDFGDNPQWGYRKEITITNNTGSALSDYQVEVTIDYDSDMQSDFDDLRFTASDGNTVLEYWVEKYTESTSATVWVKVPSIPTGDSTIYVHYGNDEVGSLSDGNATFEFFDDFSGDSVDTGKWEGDFTGFSVTSGELKGTNTTGKLHSIKAFNSGMEILTKIRIDSNATNGITPAAFFAATNNTIGALLCSGTQWNDYVGDDGSWFQQSATPTDTDLLILVGVNNNNSSTVSAKNYSSDSEYWSRTDSNDVSNEKVRLGRRQDDGMAGQGYVAYWDWVLVRKKQASSEPTVSVGSEEAAEKTFPATAEQNPSHTYNDAGSYTVELTVIDKDGNSDIETKTGYITVSEPTPPTADFSGSPTSGDAPLTVNFTDESTGTITSWEWDFGEKWPYRKPITISNPGSELTDHQVKIEISHVGGKMRSDFADLQFTADDGTILLDYWLEKYTVSSVATVWVKIPTIPAENSKIYVYYGMPNAASASNAEATFDFFDDFGDTTISDKWQGEMTGFSVGNGELKGTNTTGCLHSIKTFNSGMEIRAKVRTVSGAANGYGPSSFFSSTTDALGVLLGSGSAYNDFVRRDSYWLDQGVKTPTGTKLLIVVGVDEQNKCIVSAESYDGSSSWWMYIGTSTVANEVIRLGKRQDELYGGQTYEAYWDWIFARKYASNVLEISVAPDVDEEAVEIGFPSTEQNPIYTYSAVDTHTVKLTVMGPLGSDDETKANYITVTLPPPVADFYADRTNGSIPFTVNFKDISTGTITSWEWDFDGDETADTSYETFTSWVQYTYDTPGKYTVALKVTNSSGTSTETKTDYIIAGDTVYVDGASGDDEQDGLAPSRAVKTIQRGLDRAIEYGGEGWIVRVADGTYTGTGNRDLDFQGYAIILSSAGGAANCTIDCQSSGRAFYFHTQETSNSIVEGFTIKNGSVSGSGPSSYGGAIYCSQSSPAIVNCTIMDNAAAAGGAIFCDNGSCIELVNCIVKNNEASGSGGGVYCNNSSHATIANCLIVSNSANYHGGGVYCYLSNVELFDSTIADNSTAPYDGGGMFVHNSDPVLKNCIVWGNTAARYGHQIRQYSTGSADLYYSDCANGTNDLYGNVNLEDCISQNPVFVSGNYRLQESSPCKNVGNNSYVPGDLTRDLDDNPRILDDTVDMGAYEYADHFVASVLPEDSAPGLPPDLSVVIIFIKPMNAATINTNNVQLLDGATPVTGTVEYDSTSWQATFTPSSNLDLDTAYTVKVTTNVQDAYGSNMEHEFTSTFTTTTAIAYDIGGSLSPTSCEAGKWYVFNVGVTNYSGADKDLSVDTKFTFTDGSHTFEANLKDATTVAAGESKTLEFELTKVDSLFDGGDYYPTLNLQGNPYSEIASVLDSLHVIETKEVVDSQVTWSGEKVFDTLQVTSTGKIIAAGELTIVANILEIMAGGEINADGQGYGANQGPGAGGQAAGGGGAGHGGEGGMGAGGSAGGIVYDSKERPILPGSGGGSGGIYWYPGGSGGGVIKLIVAGKLIINGLISANGTNGTGGTHGGGGGSGGSIWIHAGIVESNDGQIQVKGGNGGVACYQGGGGGGGRVAAYYNEGEFVIGEEGDVVFSTLVVLSPGTGFEDGQPGTFHDGKTESHLGPCQACARPNEAKVYDDMTDVCVDCTGKPNACITMPIADTLSGSWDISVSAFYNSRENADFGGPMASMWTFAFNDQILVEGDKLVHRMECGRRIKFYLDETGITFEEKTVDKYLSEPQYGEYMVLYDFTVDGGYCEVRPYQTRFYFNDDGSLDKKVDRNGLEVTCHYDTYNRLEYVRDEHTWRETSFEYNQQGLVDAVKFRYRETETEDPVYLTDRARFIKYEPYDTNKYRITKIGAGQKDGQGNITFTWKWQFEYTDVGDHLNLLVKKTSPAGRVSRIVYDNDGNPIELKAYPEGETGAPITREFQYMPDTAETVIKDREGNPTVMHYDCVLDKWIGLTDALGIESTNVFDEYGNAVTSAGPGPGGG